MNEREYIKEIKRSILINGRVDVIGVWEMVRYLRNRFEISDIDIIKRICIAAVSELVEEDMIIAGDMMEIDTYQNIDELKSIMLEKWSHLNRDPGPGEIMYAHLKEKGVQLGEIYFQELKKSQGEK